MPAQSNTQEFIQKATEKYSGFYNYSKVDYVKSTVKVTVTCPVHGDWEITPSNHLNGKACKLCHRDKLKTLFSKSQDKFIEDAKGIHGSSYDYSDVEYKNSKTYVRIKCAEHGAWEQLPLNHLKGYGCPVCAANSRGLAQRTSNEDFIKSLQQVHGDKYDYSLVEYTGLTNRITIVCRVHGEFRMIASVHKGNSNRFGANCPKCTTNGYNPGKAGILYVLVGDDAITKIGITNRKVEERLSKVSKASGKKFVAAHSYKFLNGAIPQYVEATVLRELRQQYEQPTEKFDGSTECFYNVDQTRLLSRIEELIKEHTDAQLL